MAQATIPDASQASTQSPIAVYLPVALIKKNLKSLRGVDKDHDDYRISVKQSLQRNGLKQPVAVIRDSDAKGKHPELFVLESGPFKGSFSTHDTVELWDGLHRVTAFEEILEDADEDEANFGEGISYKDFKWIRAEYHGEVAPFERLKGQVLFNKNRVETTPGQVAAQCGLMLLMRPGLTQEQLADELSMNKATMSQILRINKLPEKVRNVVNSGEVTAANAMQLAKLSNVAVDWDKWAEKAKSDNCDDFKAAVKDRRKEHADEKSGLRGGDEFAPPAPRVRKQLDILELYKDTEKQAELGLCAKTIAYIVQQDPATIAEAKAKWNGEVGKKRSKKIMEHLRKGAEANGVDFTDDDTAEDIIEAIRESGIEDSESIAQGLTAWVTDARSGKDVMPKTQAAAPKSKSTTAKVKKSKKKKK